MNQIDEKKTLKKAKRKYVAHKWLSIYVKKKAFTPYEKSIFHKFITDSQAPLNHKKYLLYIHDKYLTISSEDFTFEPVKVLLHDKLWIELYTVFNLANDADEIDLPAPKEVV